MSYTVTSGRIRPIDPAQVEGHTQELLNAVKAKMGKVPNLIKTLAHSPGVLEGYLGLSNALGKGVLPAAVREQLALTIGQFNGCEYCLSAHTLGAKYAGLTPDQVIAARKGEAS